jgi:hypothetical protein
MQSEHGIEHARKGRGSSNDCERQTLDVCIIMLFSRASFGLLDYGDF